MTPEERLACRFKDLFIRGPEGMKLIHAVSEATSLIKEAQREAVEKTKQACWNFFLNENGCHTPNGRWQEYLVLDSQYFREDFESALTPEKVLGE